MAGQPWQSDNGDGTFTNPPLYGDFPDPDIIRVGEDFYFATTTFVSVPGLTILHSRDLVNWEYVSHVIPRLDGREQYDLENGTAYRSGVYAPSLRHHQGVFHVVVTPVGKKTRVYYSPDVAGPWGYHELDVAAFDPGFFIDDDGAGYVFTSFCSDGHVTVHTLNADFSQVVATRENVFHYPNIEGSKVVKRNGWYYVFNARPADGFLLMCSRSRSVFGPYETIVSLAESAGGHQGAIVDLPDGQWYGFVMRDCGPIGRMTNIGPVFWQDDWPVWGRPEAPARVPASAPKPVQGKPIARLACSDEFNAPELGLQWQWNHNPDDARWSLTERPGWLRLRATRSAHFWTARNTLTQKALGPRCRGEVKLDLSHLEPGDICGFGTLGKVSGHIAVNCAGDGTLFLSMHVIEDTTEGQQADQWVAATPIPTGEVLLRTDLDFRANRGLCFFSTDGAVWHALGGRFELAYDWRTGTFQGVQFAIFCYNPEPGEGFVEIDYFRLTGMPHTPGSGNHKQPQKEPDKMVGEHSFKQLLVAGAIAGTGIEAAPVLRDVFADDFLIGTTLNTPMVDGRDSRAAELAGREFSVLTAENDMKWQSLHPAPGRYRFAAADRYVEFGEQHGMAVIGHTLVWHSQTPAWVFQGEGQEDATRDELLARMQDHISTVAGRYRGRIKGWDVVNEAIADGGPDGLRDSPWRRIIGDDFLDHAFRLAHEADPEAELYYNDYGLASPGKRARAVAMLKGLLERGVPIHGVGMQGHYNLKWPGLAEVEKSVEAFAALGLKVMITELDVDVLPSRGNAEVADIARRETPDAALNPYIDGLPDSVQQQLAERYAGLFGVFLKHREQITRVTFWGLDDGHSWLNGFPIRGRTNHPLLFDRKLQPKPAHAAVLRLGSSFPHRPVAFDWFEYEGTDRTLDRALLPGEYHNPILAGFYPDPSICRVGDDYYLVNSTFAYFPGIPVLHSRDLVNWEQIGHVIHRPDQLRYDRVGVSDGIFAPDISYHDGVFYVVCTMVGGDGNFVVTASDPAGPWSAPTRLHFEGIDPSLFFDDDGRAWLVNNGAPEQEPLYDGHRAIWLQEFDPVAKRMVGKRTVLVNGGIDISTKPIWIEGPHLLKRGEWYYLCCAEGGTGPGHSQVILRSRTVDGPYAPWDKNPILTQRNLPSDTPGAVTCTGHADLTPGPDGRWWSVFLGVRPYQQGRFSPMGRETFLLPVTWTDDDWPMILPPGERVPLTASAPAEAVVRPSASLPLNGNFVWRDDFVGEGLSPLWIMLRTPHRPWWRLDSERARLELVPQSQGLSESANLSFLARRVQHARFAASVRLSVPAEQGVSAGLAVFQNERYHYFLAVRSCDDGCRVYLEEAKGGSPVQVASATLSGAVELQLRIRSDEATCSFDYRVGDTEWRPLVAGLDATILTSDVAGGFVGATIGLHARADW